MTIQKKKYNIDVYILDVTIYLFGFNSIKNAFLKKINN